MRNKMGALFPAGGFIPAQSRHKPYTGIDSAPETILSNR
jgi:hypothetical protein